MKELGEKQLPEEKAITEEGKEALQEAERVAEELEKAEEPQKKDVNMEKQTTEKPRVALEVPDSVHVSITKENLKDYVGPPVFTSDRLYDIPPPGVVMGLAWTQMGGAALYVESILEGPLAASRGPGLERTGSLKDVMKESAVVAYSFVKGLMTRQMPENRFFEKARVHLHCPEGAVPKDGKKRIFPIRSPCCTSARNTAFVGSQPLMHPIPRPLCWCDDGNIDAVVGTGPQSQSDNRHDRRADRHRQGAAHRWAPREGGRSPQVRCEDHHLPRRQHVGLA